MRSVVQARLDAESQEALRRLVRRLGWSPSKVVREGIRLVDSCYGQSAAQRIIGLGKFASNIPDLATNPEHMKGFGR